MEENKFSRRQTLKMAAAAAATLSGVAQFLAGCGGGGGGGGSQGGQPPVTLRQQSGGVNRAEIGGTNLKVASMYADPAAAEGGFSVPVSGEGAQLLLVQDASGAPRGLAITQPGNGPLQIDATTTATALAFLSPGICSSRLTDANEVLSQITSHDQFPTLVARAKALLPTAGLAGLRDDTLAQTSIEAIITSISEANATRGTGPNNSLINFRGRFGGGPDNAKQVLLENGSFRFVSIHEAKLDSQGRVVAHGQMRDAKGVPIKAMMSSNGVTLGNIVTGSVGAPSNLTAVTNLVDSANTARLKIFVSGPGVLFPLSETLPFEDADVGEADWKTYGALVLLPVIDILAGAAGKIVNGFEEIGKVMTALFAAAPAGTVGAAQTASSWLEKGLSAEFGAALLDFFLGAVALGAGLAAIFVSTPFVLVLAAILAGIAAVMGAANLAGITAALLRYPRHQSIELDLATGGVIVK